MFAHTDMIPNTTNSGGVVFALTNRYGGYSQPPYESLNLAFHTGDEAWVVERNLACVLEHFRALDSRGAHARTLAYMTQIHSTRCVSLDESICGEQTPQSGVGVHMGEADVLLLSRTHTPAMVLVADCNPILLFDRAHNVATLIHAGRLGVFSRICSQALARMHAHCGTRARDVYAFVGAGIRKCCYEIKDDVRMELERACGDAHRYIEVREGRYFLDLESMIKSELKDLGIVDYYFLPRCSSCDEEFFSYRRDGVTGRFGLIAMLV